MRYFGVGVLLLAVGELLSLMVVASWLGVGATLLLIVISALVGMLMLRHLGFSSVMLAGSLFQSEGEMSLYQLLWPLRYILAALGFISPGFLSTLIALILLLPIKGGPAAVSTKQGFRKHYANDVIEGDYQEVSPRRVKEEVLLKE